MGITVVLTFMLDGEYYEIKHKVVYIVVTLCYCIVGDLLTIYFSS